MTEKRKANRLQISMRVLIVGHGTARIPCMMLDICSSGALLELGEEAGAAAAGGHALAFNKGDALVLSMQLGHGDKLREHRLNCRIARLRERQLGVAFFQPNQSTLALLLARANPMPADGAPSQPRPVLSAEAGEIIAHLDEQVLSYCAGQVQDYVQRVENELFKTADSASSNNDQRQLFDVMTQLRRDRGQVERRFLEELRQRMLVDRGRSWAERIPSGGLALVSKEQLEDWLVVRIMSNTLETSHGEELSALRQRLQALTGQEGGAADHYAPSVFCEAFQVVVMELRVVALAQRILYKTFEASVLAGIGQLYAELNQTLIGAGILPQIPAPGAARPPAKSNGSGRGKADAGHEESDEAPVVKPRRKAQAKSQVAPQDNDDADLPPARAVVSALRRLLRTELDHPMSAGQQAAPAEPGSRIRPGSHDYAAELAAHSADFAPEDVRRSFALLKQAQGAWRECLDELSSGQGQEPDDTVRASLHMSSGVLQNLEQNRLLGDNAKSWFSRLELAMMHVLMAEDDLMQADSPARKVFNSLARLGYKDYPMAGEQEKVVNQLVDRISREFDTNDNIFTQAMAVLTPFVERQDRVFDHNLQRVVRMAEGEQKHEAARRTVQEKLDERFGGREVPKALLALLDAGWRDHLINTCLRSGASGVEWNRHFRVLEQLLDVEKARKKGSAIIGMAGNVLREISGTGGPQQAQALLALRALLTPGAAEDRVQTPAPAGAAATPSNKWTDRARRLAVDDWLELRSGGPEAERIRLAWHASDDSRFVFVNHQGLKVADYSLTELAVVLQRADTLVLHEHATPVVDDALEDVVQGSYDRQAWRSTHDELTGLLNRPEFTRRLDRAVDSAQRNRRQHVLGCINIDQFKVANSAGFAAGDQFLREIAELLGRTLPARSCLARLGGDKFALLLEDCGLDAARTLVHKRQVELAERHFSANGKTYYLTASAGLVVVDGSQGPARSLSMAEEACAAARVEGGNRLRAVGGESDGPARKEHLWVERLSQPLEAEHIKLRCQLIQAIDPELRDEEMPHYEILLGLRDAKAPEESPGEFLEVAERHHRMLQVDRWVVDTALQWFEDNRDKLDGLSMMSVNLSGQSLSDLSMMNYLLTRLRATDLPLAKLCFEVTEQLAIDNLADTADFMRELKKLGCHFALDDFGVGHATYHYIKHLPLDYIKIDGSFVREIHLNANDYVMVRSINDLAHHMGIKTIAEYVENDQVLAKLTEIGVDYAQGYGIERPRWLSSI